MRTQLLVTAMALAAGSVYAATPARGEKVLFEDAHIRFVEVLYGPGANKAAANPYRSVVFSDATVPKSEVVGAGVLEISQTATPPGADQPWCYTQGPVGAHTVTVNDDFPQHFYRVDYKRIDGKDYPSKWSTWYKDVFGPPKVKKADLGNSLVGTEPFSKEWPYNIKYSAIDAAPANHPLLYVDDHIEVIEVVIRPGETENQHGHPYPSVYADDGGAMPDGAVYENVELIHNPPPWMGKPTGSPKGPNFPICFTALPEPPHQVSVRQGAPQHFYRIHFKRVDGDAIKANWRSWYPAGK